MDANYRLVKFTYDYDTLRKFRNNKFDLHFG